MKSLLVSTAILIGATMPSLADITTKPSNKSVSDTVDALEAAVEGAGANVVARVDHAGSAQSVDLELAESQLLIFGNPQLGTLPQQDDIRAGLMLPLRVLVYADADGNTQIAYEETAALFEGLDIPAEAEYLGKMNAALGKLTDKAAE